MGWKDFFFGGSKDPRPKKIVRAEKKILNMYIQAQDRQYYLHQLFEDGSDDAIKVLIKRFTQSADNTTVDREEKEATCNYLIKLGDKSVPYLKAYLRTHDEGVNWPFRALKSLLDEEALIDFLIEILNDIGPEYVRQPERKEQMILTAKEFRDEKLSQALIPFLEDYNETIRFLASEVLLTHGFEFAKEPLIELIKREESMRVIQKVIDGFMANGWKVNKGKDQALREKLPENVILTTQGYFEKR